MNRTEAINKIAEWKINQLDKNERSSYLIGWWNINETDKEFQSLPEALQKEMKENSEYGNPENKQYNPLIIEALIHDFKGVRNEYLERELKKFTKSVIRVQGAIDQFEKCPCCGYKTLPIRGNWDICEVCYWEDDGTEELDIKSGPNRMTLRQAKENYSRFGACEEVLIQYAEKEADLKYEK